MSSNQAQSAEQIADAREQQRRDAVDHAARYPHGNAPPSHLPERDERGQLTRAGMEAVVKNGGSVSYNGRVRGKPFSGLINHVDHLPTEGDLAGDDVRATEDALKALDARAASLNAERDQIHQRLANAKRSDAGTGKDPKATAGQKATPNTPPTPEEGAAPPPQGQQGGNQGQQHPKK